MTSANMLRLPPDWDDAPAGYPPVDEGDYAVEVVRLEHEDHERVYAAFEIRSPGPWQRRLLFQTYNLMSEGGRRSFKELVRVLGLAPQGACLDLDPGLYQALEVSVRRHTRNGKTYANIVSLRRPGPDPA